MVGFEVMTHFGTAAFVAAGGYHHHLGFNTWRGEGVPSAPEDAVGLHHWTVLLDSRSLAELRDRFEAAGVEIEQLDDGLLVRDPWGIATVFTVAERRARAIGSPAAWQGEGDESRRSSGCWARPPCSPRRPLSRRGGSTSPGRWTPPSARSSRTRIPPRPAPTASAASPPAPTPSPSSSSTACSPTRRSTGGRSLPILKNRGFCVFSLTYGTKEDVKGGTYQPGGITTMQSSARELKAFVERVLRRTGAEKVDIVGHSEGSLMPSWYVRFLGGGQVVDDYVGMTTLWEGTNPAGLATLNDIAAALGLNPALQATIDSFCSSCRQFLQGSRFFKRLHARGTTSRRVEYTSIVTKNDELVMPYTSGLLPKAPNVTNVVLQRYCQLDQAEHLSVFADPVTAGFIWRALDPKRATKPPCVPVAPVRRRSGIRRRLERSGMAPFTHKKLEEVEDSASSFGFSPQMEARFATSDVDAEDTGFSFHRIQGGERQPFGHSHDEAEEVYVVVAGSGRMKLDDEIIEVERLDAIRVSPGVIRAFEAGPDGIELLAFGPRHEGDGEIHQGWWAD